MNTDGLNATARTVRALSMDAIQKANSGHPGLPMGLAELGSLLYGEVLKHAPHDPDWIDRDRFVLSAGHGSMLLYSLLHLSGYKISLDDIKNFRQLGSKTPGHPEYRHSPGVETTTGPLGAGFSNAVGMAVAETMLAATFNTKDHRIIDHYTYALAGDGCMMEGLTSEAASLAGHLALGKLIVFYDSNKISIEGNTSLAFSEDVAARYRAYNWQVLESDAYDLEKIQSLIRQGQRETERPTLIIINSLIGKGSPAKAGTHGVHGAPLGEEEVLAARRELGIPEHQDFYVDPQAEDYFREKQPLWRQQYEQWQQLFRSWAEANPELKKLWDRNMSASGVDTQAGQGNTPVDPPSSLWENVQWPDFPVGESEATRKAGGAVLQKMAELLPNLVGGSADLAPSNNSEMKAHGHYSASERKGRNLHFGVREHAMGGVVNGIALHGGFRAYGATFLVFSDYMRPAIRLAALMGIPVIYLFTHDSIFVGEDGPTHQPVEHLAALRSIPRLSVLRPADSQETVEAWKMAIERRDGPTALILTRQKLGTFRKHDPDWAAGMRRGAYIVKEAEQEVETVILATGSEVNLALEALDKLAQSEPEKARKVRLLSVSEVNKLALLSTEERAELIPPGARILAVEAGSSYSWGLFVNDPADLLCLDDFGASGPGDQVARHMGLSAERLVELLSRKE